MSVKRKPLDEPLAFQVAKVVLAYVGPCARLADVSLALKIAIEVRVCVSESRDPGERVAYPRAEAGFRALPYIIKNLSSLRLVGADAGIDWRHPFRTAPMNIVTVSRSR